jgi:hypothetical protein
MEVRRLHLESAMTDSLLSDSTTSPPRRRLRRVAAAAAVGLGLALGAVGISAAARPMSVLP